MTKAFSWQNSISLCPALFCTPRPNLPVTPGVSCLPTFAFQSPIMQVKNIRIILLCWLRQQQETNIHSAKTYYNCGLLEYIHFFSLSAYIFCLGFWNGLNQILKSHREIVPPKAMYQKELFTFYHPECILFLRNKKHLRKSDKIIIKLFRIPRYIK